MVVEAEALRDFFGRRTLKHLRVIADHHRDIPDCHTESVEQILCYRIRVQIEIGERVSVAGQELPQ
jgi:hypothetical protein